MACRKSVEGKRGEDSGERQTGPPVSMVHPTRRPRLDSAGAILFAIELSLFPLTSYLSHLTPSLPLHPCHHPGLDPLQFIAHLGQIGFHPLQGPDQVGL